MRRHPGVKTTPSCLLDGITSPGATAFAAQSADYHRHAATPRHDGSSVPPTLPNHLPGMGGPRREIARSVQMAAGAIGRPAIAAQWRNRRPREGRGTALIEPKRSPR